MKKLEYDLVKLCDREKAGSFKTRADRKTQLRQIATQLHELGYKWMRARDIGGRHVHRLLALWHEENLSVGTIKNRMATIRWWAEKIGRGHVLAKTNDHYGIPERTISTQSKAVELTEELLAAIDGPYRDWIRLSLRLQRYLGFRLEESLKFRPFAAIVRDEQAAITQINMRGSWCKGGRPRSMLIRTARQRDLLEEALTMAGRGSMIPSQLSYIDYARTFYYRTRKVGLTKKHGLRHQYCQTRYVELTGSLPANCDGDFDDWAVDDVSRRVISEEIGHRRKAVTSNYLGPAVRYKKPKEARPGLGSGGGRQAPRS